MSYEVLWSHEAFTAAEGFVTDDPTGVAALFDSIDNLATGPRPAATFPWGADLYRLRIGRYRAIYAINDTTRTVEVVHLGRSI
ncbi:MAG: type II toxin-antitoxin system RelE/ParE family toxin [Lapillicoccus sp.]